MNILRVSQQIYPEVVGGGAYHAHALSRDQAAMGHDVTVLSIRPDIDAIREDFRSGYRIVQYPSDFDLFGNDISIGAARFLRRVQSNYDVVHAHAHFYFVSNVAALFSQFDETPLVLTNHSLISQSIPAKLAEIHLETLGRYTFDRAETVFCYTDQERARLRRLVSDPTVEIVSNGIDQERFSRDGERSQLVDSSDSLSVLFVGRFVDGKRPQDAIEAFATLCEHHSDATLYLCGDGPLRESVEELVSRHGISDAVEFLGVVEYDEMPNVYRAADVLVLPSRSEGFPRTVMEALSTGTPVVSSDLPQVGPIVRKAGRTVEPGDVTALARELIELAADRDLRRSLGRAGRNVLIDEGLTWEETVQKTTELTEEVAS